MSSLTVSVHLYRGQVQVRSRPLSTAVAVSVTTKGGVDLTFFVDSADQASKIETAFNEAFAIVPEADAGQPITGEEHSIF
jgi:hypothetical protein